MTFYGIVLFDPQVPNEPASYVKNDLDKILTLRKSMLARGFLEMHAFRFDVDNQSTPPFVYHKEELLAKHRDASEKLK